MSTATTTDTGQTTSRRTTTPSSTTPATQTERSAANRLRATMAAQNVVPVAVTAGDKIESLRQWALRSVPLGGSGGRVFAGGRRQWRSGTERRAGGMRPA